MKHVQSSQKVSFHPETGPEFNTALQDHITVKHLMHPVIALG